MIGYSKSLQLLKSQLQPVVVVCTEHLGWGTDMYLHLSNYIRTTVWADICM